MVHLLELLVETIVLGLILSGVQIGMVLFGHVVITKPDLLLIG